MTTHHLITTILIFLMNTPASFAKSSVEGRGETYEITEKLKNVGPDQTSEKFAPRATKLCSGGEYEVIDRVVEKRKVRSTIRCHGVPPVSTGSDLLLAKAEVALDKKNEEKEPEQDLPKVTFARLKVGVGMLPTCSGDKLKSSSIYCGERYSVGFATGPEFGTVVKLNHYSMHRAASHPVVEDHTTKWRKEEMFATAATVSQQKEIFGIAAGFGLGYFGGLLNQREWIEYPFPESDKTLSKEKGYAWGLATEVYLEKSFVDTGIGDFHIGFGASGLFPSSTSNPHVEAKYWVLPSLEFSWVLNLKKRASSH